MRIGRKKPMKIKNKIILLSVFIIIIDLFIVGIIIERSVVSRYEKQLGKNALDIAHSVASISEIKQNVGKPDGQKIIQPIADGIRKKTGVEFIVVIDMNRMRYSHSVEDRIGKTFVGGDEGPALQGKIYTSKSVGTLGPSLRAFVPIYYNEIQVGVVAVGILMTDVNAMIWNLRCWIILAIIFGIVIGIIGSTFLAENIKNRMFGLEPHEIAAILKEHEAVLESVREGIIAVDKSGKITLMNNEARRLMNLDVDFIGEDVSNCIPNTRLKEVISSGQAEYDQEQIFLETRILTNRVPIIVNNEVVGAIASFRDMTEIRMMAEELTGVKKYVEAMRVQNHEFLNKLHTISGLIQLGNYNKAISYISKVSDSRQGLISFITKRIKDPSIGGLLLGKSGRCQELGIQFFIDQDSYLGILDDSDSGNLSVIIGNLIENATEAVMKTKIANRCIDFSIFDESKKIIISVKDNGPGIPEDIQNKIFEKGFTTRKDANRGYGLYLVKSRVEAYNGEIDFACEKSRGTEFTVIIPRGGKQSEVHKCTDCRGRSDGNGYSPAIHINDRRF